MAVLRGSFISLRSSIMPVLSASSDVLSLPASRLVDPHRPRDCGTKQRAGVPDRLLEGQGAREDAGDARNTSIPQIRQILTQPAGEGDDGHISRPAARSYARDRLPEGG